MLRPIHSQSLRCKDCQYSLWFSSPEGRLQRASEAPLSKDIFASMNVPFVLSISLHSFQAFTSASGSRRSAQSAQSSLSENMRERRCLSLSLWVASLLPSIFCHCLSNFILLRLSELIGAFVFPCPLENQLLWIAPFCRSTRWGDYNTMVLTESRAKTIVRPIAGNNSLRLYK